MGDSWGGSESPSHQLWGLEEDPGGAAHLKVFFLCSGYWRWPLMALVNAFVVFELFLPDQ